MAGNRPPEAEEEAQEGERRRSVDRGGWVWRMGFRSKLGPAELVVGYKMNEAGSAGRPYAQWLRGAPFCVLPSASCLTMKNKLPGDMLLRAFVPRKKDISYREMVIIFEANHI